MPPPLPLHNVNASWNPAVQAIYARNWLEFKGPHSRSRSDVLLGSRSSYTQKNKSSVCDASASAASGVESFVLATYNILSDVAVNTYIPTYLSIPPYLRYTFALTVCCNF